jgi:hypothetical protein
MEAADVLYGVTMEQVGVSRLIGMKLRDAEDERAPSSLVAMPQAASAQEEDAGPSRAEGAA